MKRILLSVLIMTAMLVMLVMAHSCGNSTGNFKSSPTDSAYTWVIFVTPDNWKKYDLQPNQAYIVEVKRYAKDVYDYVESGTDTKKKVWKRDSFYITDITKPVMDTTGKQMFDSLKRPMVYLYTDTMPKDHVKDLFLTTHPAIKLNK